MTGPLFLPSLEARIKDLEGAARRVRHSLDVLEHQDSSYAQDHRALLAAYEEALAVFRRHRDEAVNSGPAVLEEPNGPLCPACCRPSWPMSTNGRLWRCSAPSCAVSTFILTDRLPLRSWDVSEALADGQRLDHAGVLAKVATPRTYNIGGREVLSCAGALEAMHEAFPDGVPARIDVDVDAYVDPFAWPGSSDEESSHG